MLKVFESQCYQLDGLINNNDLNIGFRLPNNSLRNAHTLTVISYQRSFLF